MKTKSIFLAFLLAMAGVSTRAGVSIGTQAQVNVKVDVAQKGIEISPTLYGIFYEDINFASDGGLYAELIRNRSFEYDALFLDSRTRPEASNLDGEHVPAYWRAEGSTISLVTEGLLNDKQSHALKVETTAPNCGISYEGYWGINAVAGTQY